MAVRDAMRASAAQFVNPGETIQEVLGAQTGSPLVRGIAGAFGLLGALSMMAFNDYRILAVTDQRILVLDAGVWNMKKARSVVDILPRATRLGPATGVWHSIQPPSGKLWIHRRFYKDVTAADKMMFPVGNNS
jgi:hypothetical protein